MGIPYPDAAFVTKFNRDLHLVYQQRMSKLRIAVRMDGEVMANSVRFQKLGAINMVSKSRNGDIPVTNPAHNYVDATMQDKYLRVLIDKLDLAKMNIDVRNGYINSMVASANRQTDDFIISALQSGGSTNYVGDYSATMSRNLAIQVNETMDALDVDRDGRRFCALTPHQWGAMMTIDQFTRADYNGPDDLAFKKMGFEVRTWNDIHWLMHNRLPGKGTANAKCYAWHMQAVGHGVASEIDLQWVWSNEKFAWDGAGALSMGSAVIDVNGVVEVRVGDTVAFAS